MTDTNTPYFDEAFKNFWYDDQLSAYIMQFMAIFSGMYVKIGTNSFSSDNGLVEIPIRYGGVDRVVESIISGNTTNKPLRLPMFSAKLVDIQPAPERYKGVGSQDRYSFLPRGERLPDGIKVARRRTPIPYKLAFELNIFTSNDLQKFQILEQILPLFDPSIQIQTSDDPLNGGKITILQLETIGFEENFPSGTEKKVNISSLIFSTYGWLQTPVNLKSDFIKSIHLKLKVLEDNQDFADAISDEINNPQTNDITLGDVDQMKDFPSS